eukprot:c8490_g1_i5.p1 GENE.c8490_g1_i5~~c8490_g1_i5.p1  ORF type:complete len:145 (+),score=23.55 c8490_g1_i5:390-824(+)
MFPICQTPLHFAVMGNRVSECVILTAFGADSSIASMIDETPLDQAIEQKRDSRIISFLKFPFTPSLRSEMRVRKIYSMNQWEAFQKEKWNFFCLGRNLRVGEASPIKYLVDDVLSVIAVAYFGSIEHENVSEKAKVGLHHKKKK